MSDHPSNTYPWLTSEYLQKILRIFLKDNSISVKSFTIGPGSSPGDSYAAQLFRIKLEYTQENQQKTRDIIAKAIPETELTTEWNKAGYNMYETEFKMMSTLPLLHQELLAKGITQKFFPYLYKFDTDTKMIFMQDLKDEGYTLANQKLFLDLDHVLLAAKTLALIHASGYLLLKKNPTIKKNFLNFLHKNIKGSIIEKYSTASYRYLLKFLEKWPISEEDKKIFRFLEGKVFQRSTAAYVRRDSSFNVLIHGDYTIRNMMFTYEDERVKTVKIFDYQDCNYNSIGLDFNYFLFTSAQNYVIVDHLDEVFKTYYDEFVKVTGEIEGFTVDTVWKEFAERLGYGFETALLLRSLMHADEACDLDAFVQDKDSETNVKIYEDEKYINDIVKLLPVFKRHGIFKK